MADVVFKRGDGGRSDVKQMAWISGQSAADPAFGEILPHGAMDPMIANAYRVRLGERRPAGMKNIAEYILVPWGGPPRTTAPGMMGMQTENKDAGIQGRHWPAKTNCPGRRAGADRAGMDSFQNNVMKPNGVVVDMRNRSSLSFDTRDDVRRATRAEKSTLKSWIDSHPEAYAHISPPRIKHGAGFRLSHSTPLDGIAQQHEDHERVAPCHDWGLSGVAQASACQNSDRVVAFGYAFTNFPKMY